jgi:Rab guanine nucleotide exchange factor SEC2
MVVTAREEAQKEHDIVQRRNDQLKAQLADTESLLKSQQEQLAELKQVMEHMTEERDDQTNPTAPSTPGLSKFDSKEDSQDTDATRPASVPETISPTYPTSYTHLIQTVLRTDLSSFEDFTSLLRMSKNIPTGSRVSSGSYGSIGLGLGLGGYAPHTAPNNGSTSSLSTAGTLGSTPVTPTTPASTISTGSTNGPNSLTPLKETKFYKRALAEDIEPTLRLDSAPGLSWLARRTVLNAVCEGTLVVEPMPASTKLYVFACSLCGETRKDPAHARSHRFRTSENDNAQRYPLCKYCLGRVRSTCDFLGFLRILKDGHWRAEDEESEKAAWEESVRLREQMFWRRIGGGCIPAHHHPDPTRSPRISEDERQEQERTLSEELERTGEIQPKDVTPVPESGTDASKRDSIKSMNKPVVKDDPADDAWQAAQADAAEPGPVETPLKQVETVEEPTDVTENLKSLAETRDTTRDSTQSTSSLKIPPLSEGEKEEVKRLSITIPGSFQ